VRSATLWRQTRWQTTPAPLLLRRLQAIHAPALRRRITVAVTLPRHRHHRHLDSAFIWVGYFLYVSYKIHIQEQKKNIKIKTIKKIKKN
jgi:hypothetical protein